MYEVNGVTGHGDMPSIAGTEAGPAIVIAGAACVWDDVRAALALFGGFDFKNHGPVFIRRSLYHTDPAGRIIIVAHFGNHHG